MGFFRCQRLRRFNSNPKSEHQIFLGGRGGGLAGEKGSEEKRIERKRDRERDFFVFFVKEPELRAKRN